MNSVTGIRLRVAATGQTGTVVAKEPGGYALLELDGGGTLAVGPDEIVQIVPPGWDLAPAARTETP